MNEYRSSFHPSPFVAYVGEQTAGDELQRLATVDDPTSPSAGKLPPTPGRWETATRKWTERIEQRWFVGAHANVGGGYPDNVLSERPLQWIMEGACEEGLISENPPPLVPVTAAQAKPRDSYAEFAAPLWTAVLRAKRYYRVINPEPELRANRDEAKNPGPPRPGFPWPAFTKRLTNRRSNTGAPAMRLRPM